MDKVIFKFQDGTKVEKEYGAQVRGAILKGKRPVRFALNIDRTFYTAEEAMQFSKWIRECASALDPNAGDIRGRFYPNRPRGNFVIDDPDANECEASFNEWFEMQEEQKCKWVEDEDGIYNSECNNSFYFEDGSSLNEPNNKFIYCPHCNKPIEAIDFIDDAEDLQ